MEILPNYDKDRVYVSDIKKVIQWYNLMQELKILNFEEEPKEADAIDDTKHSHTEEGVKKPTAKTPAKKSAKPATAKPMTTKPKSAAVKATVSKPRKGEG